eukprot:CAMPEP_0169145380 /NCGR_PEP_ID=MMETSP1015-20121227/46877_1 /TAXON_ID=342587 /ORGANISM="Karlodinium micrum, Strain CCMP2283" /LENGTH=127 /DNA_ID=CAMNT_0009212959 /DNA_START=92 /DNA_END=472 /DNA_ORIENTATION=+
MTMQSNTANMVAHMPMGTPLVAEAVAPGTMPLAANAYTGAPMTAAPMPQTSQLVGMPMVHGGMPMTDPMMPITQGSHFYPGSMQMGNTFAAAEAAARAEGTPKQALDLKHERLVGSILTYQPLNGSG